MWFRFEVKICCHISAHAHPMDQNLPTLLQAVLPGKIRIYKIYKIQNKDNTKFTKFTKFKTKIIQNKICSHILHDCKILKIQIKINQKKSIFWGVSEGMLLVVMVMMLTPSFSTCFRLVVTLRKDILLSDNETGSCNPCYVVTQDICV